MSVSTVRETHNNDTRQLFIRTARRLFTRKGYGGASTEEIIRRAQGSRGAMYHHFPSKEDLFAAVFEQVEQEVIERLAETGAQGKDWVERIANGCLAFLDTCLDPKLNRILLVDGPAVLGWRRWREIEERYGFGLLLQFLETAIRKGHMESQPVEPVAHLIAGALNEAAMVIVNAEDQAAAREQMGKAVTDLIERLRVGGARHSVSGDGRADASDNSSSGREQVTKPASVGTG
jgi:AcrR family transcriptional regulator